MGVVSGSVTSTYSVNVLACVLSSVSTHVALPFPNAYDVDRQSSCSVVSVAVTLIAT